MGRIELKYDDGQTPLEEEEKDGLLPTAVTTKGELDEVEQRNIEDAIRWTMQRRKKFKKEEILTEAFVMELHKTMFGEVWKWAGEFRKTDKNLGVSKYQIGTDLKVLLDDCAYWIDHNIYEADEIAIRLKHRIVLIHCFANGNGRHSRLIADIIVEKVFGKKVFSWGSVQLVQQGIARAGYLQALREADKGNYEPLIVFARS
ncbi:MAG: mobile mystery protein B [Bacteroidota bacterium]